MPGTYLPGLRKAPSVGKAGSARTHKPGLWVCYSEAGDTFPSRGHPYPSLHPRNLVQSSLILPLHLLDSQHSHPSRVTVAMCAGSWRRLRIHGHGGSQEGVHGISWSCFPQSSRGAINMRTPSPLIGTTLGGYHYPQNTSAEEAKTS